MKRDRAAHRFVIDAMSIGVSALDVVNFVTSSGDAGARGGTFRIFRVIRALRLIKLVRLVRASRMFKRWETRLSINYGMLILTSWSSSPPTHTLPAHGTLTSRPVQGANAWARCRKPRCSYRL